MSHIHTPATIAQSPVASRPLLEALRVQLGSAPNMYRLIGSSPAALEGYLALAGALGRGDLDLKTRQRIALRVAELNACSYCLSAHSYVAKNHVRLAEDDLAASRRGTSNDRKTAAALHFATQLVRERGHVGEDEIRAVKQAGYGDGEVVEIVLHVALNTLTNYVNSALATEVDFPQVRPHRL